MLLEVVEVVRSSMVVECRCAGDRNYSGVLPAICAAVGMSLTAKGDIPLGEAVAHHEGGKDSNMPYLLVMFLASMEACQWQE